MDTEYGLPATGEVAKDSFHVWVSFRKGLHRLLRIFGNLTRAVTGSEIFANAVRASIKVAFEQYYDVIWGYRRHCEPLGKLPDSHFEYASLTHTSNPSDLSGPVPMHLR
jgi:hypothetical protein